MASSALRREILRPTALLHLSLTTTVRDHGHHRTERAPVARPIERIWAGVGPLALLAVSLAAGNRLDVAHWVAGAYIAAH